MPSFIVKATPEDDWYCFWSTVVDAPTRWGTREELTLACRYDRREIAAERFARADRNGTSAAIPDTADDEQWFGWNDSPFILMEAGPERRGDGCWLLPRENLRAFCEALDGNRNTTPLCIWEQYEDDATEATP